VDAILPSQRDRECACFPTGTPRSLFSECARLRRPPACRGAASARLSRYRRRTGPPEWPAGGSLGLRCNGHIFMAAQRSSRPCYCNI